MIHAADDHFVISSYHVWRPGAYKDKRAARYAFRFPDEILQKLQNSINPMGIITFEMLKNAKTSVKSE